MFFHIIFFIMTVRLKGKLILNTYGRFAHISTGENGYEMLSYHKVWQADQIR